MRLTHFLLATLLGLCACQLPPAAEVGPAGELLADGPLHLVEEDLRAEVRGNTLVVHGPAFAGWLPGPMRLQLALRKLDGTLLGRADTGVLGHASWTVELGGANGLDARDVQADRVLHLQAAMGPWEVHSRRSALALLRSPDLRLAVPEDVPVGAQVPVVVGASTEATGMSLGAEGGGGSAGTLETVAGGAVGSVTFSTPGDAQVRVMASREGAPRTLTHPVRVRPDSRAYLVLSRPTVGPGETLDVVVVGAPAGAHVTLETLEGTELTASTLQPLGNGVTRAVVVMPRVGASSAWVVLRDENNELARSAVRMAPMGGLEARLRLTSEERDGQATLIFSAQDPYGRPIHGNVRIHVVSQGTRTVDAVGALEDGMFFIQARTAALLGGPDTGVVSWSALVTSEAGPSAGANGLLALGGAGLQLLVQPLPCAALGPCRVRVLALRVDGAPVAANGEARLDGVATRLEIDASGEGILALLPREEGAHLLELDACTAEGACGAALAVLQAAPAGTALIDVDAPTQVPTGNDAPITLHAPNHPAGGLLLHDAVAAPMGDALAVFVAGAGWSAAPETTSLTTGRVGLKNLEGVALQPSGDLLSHAVPFAVTPLEGTAPEVNVGESVAASGEGLVMLQLTCGVSEVGRPWGEGVLGASSEAWSALGSPERSGSASARALVTALAPTLPSLVATEPDEQRAREYLRAYVQHDLDLVATEARSLVQEGTLTPTTSGPWLVRRADAYVDPFGRPYRLETVAGRLVLRSLGPDEIPGSGDEVEASVPLEVLFSDVTPLPPMSDRVGMDAPLAIPHEGTPVAWGDGSVVQERFPACGAEARVRAVRVGSDGAIGVREAGARDLVDTMLRVDLPPTLHEGDQIALPVAVEGRGAFDAELRAEGAVGGAPLMLRGLSSPFATTWNVQTNGNGTGWILGTSSLPLRQTTDVLPDGLTTPTHVVTACGDHCEVTLEAGQELEVWDSHRTGCASVLRELSSRVFEDPRSAAAAATWAARARVPGAEELLQRALDVAVATRGDDVRDTLTTLETLVRAASVFPRGNNELRAQLAEVALSGTDESGTVRFTFPDVRSLSPQHEHWSAVLAMGLALDHPERARAVATRVLEATAGNPDHDAAGLALEALHAAGGDVTTWIPQVNAAVGLPVEGAAALVRVLVARGEDPGSGMSRLLGGRGALHNTWAGASALCALAEAPAAAGSTTVRDPQGALVAEWASGSRGPRRVRAATPGAHVVDGDAALIVARSWDVVAWAANRGPEVTWGASTAALDDVVVLSLRNLPLRETAAWIRLRAPPGGTVVLDSIRRAGKTAGIWPVDATEAWVHVPDTEFDGLTWAVRLRAEGRFRANPVEVRVRHGAGVDVESPPIITVTGEAGD
ncbi:MAG: hypothetical protein AB2A00_12755 [Myxococcota bacterium]